MRRASSSRALQAVYLHGPQQCDGGGVIDDALTKDQGVQQRHLVLLQHLKHGHAVGRGENDSQCETVLQGLSARSLHEGTHGQQGEG